MKKGTAILLGLIPPTLLVGWSLYNKIEASKQLEFSVFKVTLNKLQLNNIFGTVQVKVINPTDQVFLVESIKMGFWYKGELVTTMSTSNGSINPGTGIISFEVLFENRNIIKAILAILLKGTSTKIDVTGDLKYSTWLLPLNLPIGLSFDLKEVLKSYLESLLDINING